MYDNVLYHTKREVELPAALSPERTHQEPISDDRSLLVTVRLIEEPSGSDHIRAEAYLVDEKGKRLIGGADVVLFAPSALFSVLPHSAGFIQNGLMLMIASSLIGAIGPVIGRCLGDQDIKGRFRVRQTVEAELDTMLAKAVSAVKACLD